MNRPKDTPFEDGTFKLTIEFTEEYPNKPPTVRFVSKMFHPNGEQKQLGLPVFMTHYMFSSLDVLSLPSLMTPHATCTFGLPSLSLAVYADGSICLDILQNRWSPTYDVSSILTSIQVRFMIVEHPLLVSQLVAIQQYLRVYVLFGSLLDCCSV